jgi:hypothetical protein
MTDTEQRDNGADAITRWADATAPQPPTQPETTANRDVPTAKPLTNRVLWWVHNHADRDLTVDEIWDGVNELRLNEDAPLVSRTQIVQALYAIRQRPSNDALHLELGGHQRPGHVRWWTNPRQRPTPDRKERRVKEVATARRKRAKGLKQLDVPTPTPPEPTPTSPTEYIELGVLTDGAVVLMANGDLYLATRYRPVTP